jgi:hypothetical protein
MNTEDDAVKLDRDGIRGTVSELPQRARFKTGNSFPLNKSTAENRACMRGLSKQEGYRTEDIQKWLWFAQEPPKSAPARLPPNPTNSVVI